MAGAVHKTMKFLGLTAEEQDEYAEDEYYDETGADVVQDYDAQVTPLRRVEHEVAPLVDSELRRITTVHPRSYNDARAIGEAFRAGTPVIINLSDMDDSDAKRLVDFSAGLIFGLHGAIERVTSKVFLLSPEHVEIAGEEATREGSRAGFYNQS